MITAALLPTAAPAWDYLGQARQQARLGQSLLLSGGPGLGKAALAEALIAALLCEQSAGDDFQVCGGCHSCHLRMVGNHPDLLRISPEEEGKSIAVDAVREASVFLQDTPQVASRRILYLAPAEAMQHHAANALLKTLEEPGPRAQIILLSHQANRLLATIRSRCQKITLQPLQEADLQRWLMAQPSIDADAAAQAARISYGRPQMALHWLRDGRLDKRRAWLRAFLTLPAHTPGPALSLASQWAKDTDLADILMAVHGVLADLLRLRLGLGEQILNLDFADSLGAVNVHLPALLALEMAWRQAYLAKQQNLNLAFVLEGLLLDWQNARNGLKI